jgi:Cu/Ag efflux pump CusA
MNGQTIQLRVSLEQMALMIDAFRNVVQTMLPESAQLTKLMSEGSLEMIKRMRGEIAVNVAGLDTTQLQAPVARMRRLVNEVVALHEMLLPQQPEEFRAQVQIPLDEIDRIRQEMLALIEQPEWTAGQVSSQRVAQ